MSTAEVEAALTEHPAVAEAAVVSRPHKVKGECLYCFVTLKNSREFNHMLVEELKRLGEAFLEESTQNDANSRSKFFTKFTFFLLMDWFHLLALWLGNL